MKYELIRKAIIDRRSLTCMYDGCIRSVSPHVLGKSAEGRFCMVAFQYAGARPDGLLSPAGEWCCFDIEKVGRLRENEDRWVAGSIGERPAGCVKDIEVKA